MIQYISTRDVSKSPKKISSAEAIKIGLAPDGGLFMPDAIPELPMAEILEMTSMSYDERAAFILSKYLTDYDPALLKKECKTAYNTERFPEGPTQMAALDDHIYSLELWHGPTCAFKDMALQIMPRLLSNALRMTGERRLAHILVATSGDTGKAALEGFRDVPGTKISVFYPENGVSRMQKLQMQTQEGDNVRVCAVRGNFDDAQNGVKAIFGNADFAKKANEENTFFSSANSINWGRLVPQVVYYVSAYCDLLNRKAILPGEKINICVPTGNFGNIFAAFLAFKMGLPVNRFICASNSNNVLTDFIKTGTYNRKRTFHETMSPSMDILISSNLERLLYALAGPEITADCMKKLSQEGAYTLPEELHKKVQNLFTGYWTSEEDTSATIRRYFNEENYLCDTHTAVALFAARQYVKETGDKTPTVVASTASPFKFSRDVCGALGTPCNSDDPATLLSTLEKAGHATAPRPLAKVLTLPVRFSTVVNKEEMPTFVFAN